VACRGGWTLHDPQLAPRTVPADVVKFCYLSPMLFPDGGYFKFRDQYMSAFADEIAARCVFVSEASNTLEVFVVYKLRTQNRRFLKEMAGLIERVALR
jgi:hypothetical protein